MDCFLNFFWSYSISILFYHISSFDFFLSRIYKKLKDVNKAFHVGISIHCACDVVQAVPMYLFLLLRYELKIFITEVGVIDIVGLIMV